MSWQEDFRNSYPCPCGEGQYIAIASSDDWNRSKTEYKMLCPKCKELYEYSKENVRKGCIPGHEIERGGVLKSVLEAKQAKHMSELKLEREGYLKREKVRKKILNKVKELYFKTWTEKFEALKTKKTIHNLLNYNGSYEAFCQETRKYTRAELLEYVNTFFIYKNLKQIFKVCEINASDWSYLGVSNDYRKEIKNSSDGCQNF